MSTAEQIEEAIRILPANEKDRLFLHLEQQYAASFDAAIERDLHSGALDKFINSALDEAETGSLREL